jgi:UV DNA damage endonuclease
MKLGLVAISEILKEKKISFRTMTRKSFLSKPKEIAIAQLGEIYLHNVKVTGKVIEHCAKNGIKHYRLSSALFPLFTYFNFIETSLETEIIQIKNAARNIGNFAKANGVSLSSHPDQYNVLASLNQNVVDSTIKELNHQGWVMDIFGCERNISSPMCLHVSRSPDFTKETRASFRELFFKNYLLCDSSVISRLVLENEDKGYWSAKNLYENFGNLFTLVYDNLHDDCNPSDLENKISKFKNTWKKHIPVFHWSEGLPEKKRSHSDYFSCIPDCVMNNQDVIWECEVKAKDKAILEILKTNAK